MVSGVTIPANGRQAAPAEHLAFHGQAAALVVGEAQPVRPVRRAEDSILLEQVVNDRLLLAIDPAGEATIGITAPQQLRAHHW